MNFYSTCEYKKFPISNFIKITISEFDFIFIGQFFHGVIEGEDVVKVLHNITVPARDWNTIDYIHWISLVDKKALWEPVSENELMAFL